MMGNSQRNAPLAESQKRGRPDDGSREQVMVPRAEFRSYYGWPVLKPPVWEWKIPAYLFTGGLSAGSAVLAAGADLTTRPALRRASRINSVVTLLVSGYLLIADLGRPERFHHMLRVAKPTSPMSVGTWILTLYAPGVGIAALSELLPARARRTMPGRLLDRIARPAAIASAVVAPGVASYTAVLLSQDHRARLARGAPAAAVHLHRLGGSEREWAGDGADPRGRSRPGTDVRLVWRRQ